ncbi:OmpA family protein [Flavihumibacter stibioxidans]|uniref:OmpA-like domain-containing protein n=1 Tax=Flavihumibacter stibioxidans TaxID=1834163 RepID=A0ABR7MCI1_9BACT|nr:OmpA family protein [Flavihumibacter stibioxidans]MBC6492445.1 hypothetical protein [Flavihumibacter stibioxidans]
MRKILFATALAATISGAVSAQEGENDYFIGAKAGLNISTFKLDGAVPAGHKSEFKFQPVAGFFMNMPLSKKFSVQPELLYSIMGSNVKNSGSDLKQRLDYLSIPLLFKYKVSNQFNLLLGPQADLLVRARQEVNSRTTNNVQNLRRDDYAATAGFEWWPAGRLVVGARYIHGLTNVRRYDDYEWFNRGVQATAGLRLSKKAAPVVIAPPPPPPPADTDNDGINDNEDKCPTVAGLAKYNGCPVPDTDKDGINDEQDKCPSVPGIAKYNGCPIPDTDKDGVNDEEDKCKDVAGLARYQGCPIPDRDNDGVNDEEDRCPDLSGPADNGGCPKLEASKFNASAVQFVTGSSTLTAAAKKELDKAARILNEQYPQLKVEIAGHTDNTGKADKNQLLSEKRAAAVKTYLVKKGVGDDRLTTVGLGQDQPVADNATVAGRAKNRRVEFKVSQ